MNLHDPKRPTINGFPAILTAEGKPSQPFTGFNIYPVWVPSDNHYIFKVSFMAKRVRGSFHWLTATMPVDKELLIFMKELAKNPEQALEDWFGYKVPEVHATATRPELTLDDLGL